MRFSINARRWRAPVGLCFLLALLLTATPASADSCYFVIVDTLTITYTDGDGNIIGQDTRYYFGWLCFPSGGGPGYEIPVGGGGDPGGDPPGGGDPPTGGGCTVADCQANCDMEYMDAIDGETVELPWGGRTHYPCGPVCRDFAAAERDACYGFCVEDCN